jgi:nitroreductase
MDNISERSFVINPILEKRWSPRAYSATHVVDANELGPCFEAARWSPSSSNSQPWSFVVGFRGDAVFSMIIDSMVPGNALWGKNASAVVASIAMTHNAEGKEFPYAIYDVGQSVAHFSVQATSQGLLVHQMAGFDPEALGDALGLNPHHRVVSLMTVGVLGDVADLPEKLQEREASPRVRKPLSDVVFRGASY